MNVIIEDQEITIFDNKKELVKWVIDEWKQDETIIPSICNIIKLAYTNPKKLRTQLNKG